MKSRTIAAELKKPAFPKQDPFFWREQWRKLKLAHCAVPGYGNAHQFWKNRKMIDSVYMKGRKKHNSDDGARAAALAIPNGSRVLDIGTGPGTYAVPLAEHGCEVTVVEPSPVMREALAENMHEKGVRDIRIIPKRWEDVTIEELDGKFDVVIASYSLTMMDIGKALAKMQECCAGTVHLFWFLTPPAWVQVNKDLWPLLHGGEFPGEPMADWLWQVLCEMEIHANLQVEVKFPPSVYASIDDAVNDFSQRLKCSTAAHKETVSNYFQSILRQENDGFVLGGETLGAHIWWTRGLPEVTAPYNRR
ncbi:class I SAM-dependent methyltransferase [Methanoregula sp.]|jgi:SAM-dependent methyltransferase|uniref:class I SAM-dependent methyltransferase n=1 Tax=Methanoregula sp. TaxID=2052170 RepID=UPI003BAEBD99